MFKRLFALLLLSSLLFAARDWDYEDANERVCFNATSGTSGTGVASSSWYDMVLVALPHNGSFWNDTLLAYQNITDREDGLFVFAQNGSHAWVAIPLFTSGTTNFYCIYGGGDDRNTPADAAPYNLGWDSYDELLNFTSYSNGTTSISGSGSYVNMSSPDGYFAYGSSQYSTYHNPQLMAKFRRLDHDNASSNSILGVMSPNGVSTPAANGFGIGIRASNASMRWYIATTNIGPYDDAWHIYRAALQRGSGTDYGAVYDDHFNMEYSTAVSDTSTAYGSGTFLAYVRNSSAEFDWAMEFDYHSALTNWTASGVTWSAVSDNITILSPEWDGDYLLTDSLIFRVRFDGVFDNCSVYLNDADFSNYTSVAYGQTESELVSGHTVGENEIRVSCYASGVQHQRYVYFNILGGDAGELFEDAFGSDLTDNCSASVQTALGVCTESYNLSSYYNLGAVVCPGLNTSLSYFCLGLSNTTKNGYTIFYSSPTMTYVTSINVEHVGAEWYYGASPVEGGIEILNSTQFVYLPAQDKDRDCDIYYSSTSYCSFWAGFTLNRGMVIVSDRAGNWYMTGGLGIEPYTTNYSMKVYPTQLQFLVPESSEVFPQGIYTRVACRSLNGSYAIDIVNTQPREFTVDITGGSDGYTVTATALHDEIPLNGTSTIIVSDEYRTLCQYGTGDLIFLPFDFGGLPDAFGNVFVSIFMLFTVVISAVVPYALVMAFVVNDLYSILTVEQMALMGVMAAVAGIVTNITSFERGVKHMLVVVVIVLCYMSALNISDSGLGIDTTDYDNLLSSMESLTAAHSFESMAWGVATFIISLFVFLLKLPLLLTGLVFGLLHALSPTLYTAAGPFWNILYVGGNIWLYVKAYEVISNRFRQV